jgi:hypothetical protein
MPLAPPLTPARLTDDHLLREGFAVLDADAVCSLSACPLDELLAWLPTWDHLPPDAHLRDGGRYRRRRHANFVIAGGEVRLAPHRAHWQPLEYNALHGGMERWFEPMANEVVASPAWRRLLCWLAGRASALHGEQAWFTEAHQFRIDTEGGIGRPTPEGAHRDGVDLVAVFLVARSGVKGGETRVFQADAPLGTRFTLTQPWSLLLLDDARVIHETTPIQPDSAAGGGWRDTLVVTLRAGGFQGP